jgi:hypothetical protein
MSFKTGDIAYVKTTGEKVVVVGPAKDNTEALNVRRPVATKDGGLQHNLEPFYTFELESFEEQLSREFADMERVESFRSKTIAEAKAANQTPLVN